MAQRKLYRDEGCPDIPPVWNGKVQGEIYKEQPITAVLLPRYPSSLKGV
jgi:hypothetical protein